MKPAFLFLALLLTTSVFAQTRPVSIEGHRGARGWVPENTIPAFKKALELGADTLELDVVLTKDGKVVVSHEAWFSSVISLDKNGNRIPADKQRENNIYKMTYDEVKMFDVGSIGNKDFPLQEKMKVVKPLLSDVFTEIGKFVRSRKLPSPRYNIEIKTEGVTGDDVFHPKMEPFTRAVYDVIKASKMLKYVIIQSFDVRPLQELRKIDPKVPVSFLVANKDSLDKNLESLGFKPDTYSPHFMLVDVALIAACKARGIKVVPWTLNEIADLERMKTFELDGIITDYPDRVVKVFRN
ncbi:MAG TPA: glycerophosphodiester phosphodiesterase family protein [Pyrinomonadaceae bacterium]|nr:glycerophosphodiester phosphodiesterase [Acidobacteriota bacterium]HQZ98224.1 glycerophosphodiester phosphodiesterase family protein [Pyrinomonadaceae bacterium]